MPNEQQLLNIGKQEVRSKLGSVFYCQVVCCLIAPNFQRDPTYFKSCYYIWKSFLKLLNIFYFNSIGIAVQKFFRFFSSQIPLDFWHLRILRFSLYILVKLGSCVETVIFLFDISRIIMDVGTTLSAYAKFSEKT